ncbi:SBBP repeat-containing protein [Flavobacterium sp. N1994]|uniref:SBBP repeat-containing protein n=1 Tax=Flavobacterium sp. N1994 TaxID=2986827 RepID=UPI0022228720|nr:SBBP repeat-containing protein [Flavobacterium sp. N1994]
MKKLKTQISILTLLLLLSCSFVRAQNPSLLFAKGIGSKFPTGSTLVVNAIKLDGSGNRYVTGSFVATADFDPSTSTADLVSAGNSDIFIAKYDATGKYVWAIRMGGTSIEVGNSIALDSSGNVYITGYFNGTADFDPSSGTANLVASGGNDIFLAKYDASGNYVMANKIGGSGDDKGFSLSVDNGYISITGYYTGTVDFDPSASTVNLSSASGSDDIFLAKYSTVGTYVWAKSIGSSSSDEARSLAVDGSGNIVITGYFQGTVDFDPSASTANLTMAGGIDIFVAKYNSSGNYLWADRLGGTDTDVGISLALDGNGNVLVTGVFNGTADFDPSASTANLTSAGVGDIFIAKYNSSGNYVWSNRIGGTADDYGNSIAVDSSGNAFVTGYINGTTPIDFDPSANTATLTGAGGKDIFVAKYDTSGNYVGATSFGSTGDEQGLSLSVNTNSVVVAGFFNSTVDFDPSTSTANLNAPVQNGFIASYTTNGIYNDAGILGNYNSSNSLISKYIVKDSSGNLYVTGVFYGTADFDPSASTANLTSAGGTDIFIAKYDASGNYVWAKNMGGTNYDYGSSMAVDSSGNVLVTGYFAGTADFDPSASTANLTSVGASDIFIAKYDASGNYVWAKNIGGTGYGYGYSVAVDSNGNVLVTGNFSSTADFDPSASTANLTSTGGYDIFVAKYDASGNYVWAKNMGSTGSDYGYSMAVDSNGNVLVTGSFSGTADFDPSASTANLTSAGSNDIFIAKYDASGNYVWAKNMGGTSYDIAYSLALDSNGNVFVTGYFTGTADFDPSASTANLTSAGGSSDIFIAKYNSSGIYVWAKNMGSTGPDVGNSLKVDSNNNVFVTGYFAGTADFDPSASTANLTSAGSNDVFVAKYNTSGNYVWAISLGGTGNDIGNSLELDSDGNALVTGQFLDTVDFDPGSGTTNLSTGEVGKSYGFIAKYGTIYTVTFDNNTGSGTMTSQVASASTALTTNTFTKTGYHFTGWNTVANGSGTAYADGASYSFAANITLYAQWARNIPTITTVPTASNITYGQTLAFSTLSGGVASVAGTFAFTTPSTTPNAGTANQGYTFTPTDTINYTTVTGTVSVTVTKATPSITTAPIASSICLGNSLASSTLSGGIASVGGTFAFTTPSTTPSTGTANQGYTFTPTDTTNYNTVTGMVSVTVQPAPSSAGSNGTLTICSTTTLTTGLLFGALGGSPAAGGTWSPAPIGAGTYTYTQAATSPCSVNNTATVVVTVQPTAASAGTNGTLTVCAGTTPSNAQLFAALGGSPAAGGTWSNVGLVYTYTQAATSPCTVNNTATVTVTEQALPASAGSNGTLTICSTTPLTTGLLFSALTGSPAIGGTWSPALAGAGTYTYTQAATSPCTVNNTATVVVTVQPAPASAGTNGTLTVCAGTTPSNAQLFAALGGSPAAGGTWSNIGLVYTYTQTAISPCAVNNTATVTVTEQALPASAGSNGTLSICSTTTLTTGMLFGALTGSPAAGGTWSPAPAGAGTYTYTQAATSPCSVNNTATVIVSVVSALTWYQDLDGDGYGNSAVSQVTCSNLAPAYSLLGGDCNDAVATINPGVTEICYNNIDDNCSGAMSEGCAPVVVNMTPSYNNTTLVSLSTAIPAVGYSYPGTSNIKYRFSITNVTTNVTSADIIQTSRYVTIPSALHVYGATYTIKVSAVINDEVVPFYGNTITVTGPTVQLITLSSSSCGATLVSLSSTISANGGLNATGYTFRIRLASDNGPTPTYGFSPSATRFVGANSFAGFPLQYNSSYKVAVQYTYTDPLTSIPVQSGYGAECTVLTPSIPLIGLAAPTCGSQVATLNAGITASPAAYATGYRFRIRMTTDNGPTPTYYYSLPNASRFSSLVAFQGITFAYNTQYSIAVEYSILNNSVTVWSGFGSECIVQTPFFPTTSLVPSQCGLSTATSLTQQLNITPYPGFPNYKVKLDEISGEDVVNSQEIIVTYSNFRLNQFSIAQLGKNYNVSVAIKLNGVFGDYSTACDMFTAAPPRTVKLPFKATAYPNPFANNFMLDVTTSSKSVVGVKVYDMVGRLIEQREVNVSDMENTTIGDRYPSGVYNVVVSQEDSVEIVRVVKR